jgi:integrase
MQAVDVIVLLRLTVKDQKTALNQAAIRALLKWLRGPSPILNYAVYFMLLTSGLRVGECLPLRWEDLELSERCWTAPFIGKGGRTTENKLKRTPRGRGPSRLPGHVRPRPHAGASPVLDLRLAR